MPIRMTDDPQEQSQDDFNDDQGGGGNRPNFPGGGGGREPIPDPGVLSGHQHTGPCFCSAAFNAASLNF